MKERGRTLLVIGLMSIVVLLSGCAWSYRGTPYPSPVPGWPLQDSKSEKTIGIIFVTDVDPESEGIEEAVFSSTFQQATYKAFKESGKFRKVKINQADDVSYRAEVSLQWGRTSNLGWWTVASLFLIPGYEEVKSTVHVTFFTGQGAKLASLDQTVVNGKYWHLLFLATFPIEIFRTDQPGRPLQDALRALIFDAVKQGTI
jgi:hypothetical protein